MIEIGKLEQFDFLARCSLDDKKQLARLFSEVYLRKFDPVYHEEDPVEAVYLIEKGSVEMSRTSSDGQKIYSLGLLKQGDIFGFGEVFFDRHYITAMATANTVLLKIPKQDFMDTFLRIPVLTRYILDAMAAIVRQKTMMIDWEKADNRLPHLLYYLAHNYGTVQDDKIIISPRLTHETLAAALDISREHFSRLYIKLQKHGILGKTAENQLYINEQWLNSQQVDRKLARIFKRKLGDELSG